MKCTGVLLCCQIDQSQIEQTREIGGCNPNGLLQTGNRLENRSIQRWVCFSGRSRSALALPQSISSSCKSTAPRYSTVRRPSGLPHQSFCICSKRRLCHSLTEVSRPMPAKPVDISRAFASHRTACQKRPLCRWHANTISQCPSAHPHCPVEFWKIRYDNARRIGR